ncbi:MAG: hypothetical protein QM831_42275 [Kofleriaceae bacterium]
MARGRAPSHNAYRGSIGRTQTATVHVTRDNGDLAVETVYTTVDAVSDPELVERLHAQSLNAQLAVPLVYHDPAAELMVLVLGEAHRHREIEERIRLLERLKDDDAAIPAYAKDFAVVFGSAGLRAFLEQQAAEALAQAKRDGIDKREEDIARNRAAIEQAKAQLDAAHKQLEAQRAQLERDRAEQQRAQSELDRLRAEQRARVIASVQVPVVQPVGQPMTNLPPKDHRAEENLTSPITLADLVEEPTTHASVPEPAPLPEPSRPAERLSQEAIDKTPLPLPQPFHEISSEFQLAFDAAIHKSAPVEKTNGVNGHSGSHVIEFPEEETTGTAIIPPGSDPLTTDTQDIGAPEHDNWLDFAATGTESVFEVSNGRVRIALVANEQQARGLGGVLDVRLLLHRVNTYPVITLVIGPPAALRVPSVSQIVTLPLDIGVDADRQLLGTLAKQFVLDVIVIDKGAPTRQVRITAPLADNAAYILRAADDHLRGITADGEVEPSFHGARDLVMAADYDILGAQHAEANEFRDEKLAQLQTAQQLRRAIAIARRFARPSREDYLICSRGFPLVRWRELRRHVLESAVSWGIWMGPELAQVAVSEGLARSRRDLIAKLDSRLRRAAPPSDRVRYRRGRGRRQREGDRRRSARTRGRAPQEDERRDQE